MASRYTYFQRDVLFVHHPKQKRKNYDLCNNETLSLIRAIGEQESSLRHKEPRHVESCQESAIQEESRQEPQNVRRKN